MKKTKRILVFLLIFALSLVCLFSCAYTSATEYSDDELIDGQRFRKYCSQNIGNTSILVIEDVETGVKYLITKNGYSGGVTVFYDSYEDLIGNDSESDSSAGDTFYETEDK